MRLEDVLAECAYKPGYRLSIQEGDVRRLVVHAKVDDSRAPEKTNISMNWPIPSGDLPEKDWLKFIRWCLISLEIHEAGEWLRYKGGIPYDPHV